MANESVTATGTISSASRDVYALRYGSAKTAKTAKSSKYLNYKAYGEPDEEIVVDFYFWLVRVCCDLEGMYEGYERLNHLAGEPDTVGVAGHDPDVMRRFKMIDSDCVDLTASSRPRGKAHFMPPTCA